MVSLDLRSASLPFMRQTSRFAPQQIELIGAVTVDRLISRGFPNTTCRMDIYSLTVSELKRAVAIKEQIASLNNELRNIFGEPDEAGTTPKKKRTMSASARKKIAAAQKARWANHRGSKSWRSGASAAKPSKRGMSRATRAKLSRKMKARWAARRAAQE
jgi:hypothetical protein